MSVLANFKENIISGEHARDNVSYYLCPLKISLHSFFNHLFSNVNITSLNFIYSSVNTDEVFIYFCLESSKTSFTLKIPLSFVNGED
jgi:hypothetical protein